ncbi:MULTISPECIES: tetratricopeptide repeat protein [Candidatus Ichthyocystis]|uniref:Putative Tetratricopeptide repeat (TPR) protein n=1 Tax=Candidatus Ichthyocystis hellenicum TaxID=1561003 RepID=A0A0S4M4J3_9BURK|nr:MULTISPECIES: tetratricopeptide repeat protein [Ichthyocystis]CUT17080.1 putative Tetratricopeptide repeat (TPR) protein [Candidatus Ichthyocystis hellenicum]
MDKAKQDGENAESEFSDGDLFMSHLFNGGTLAEWEGRSPKLVEMFHYAAVKLYNSGRYDEAHKVFHELVRLNHLNPEYMFGLAACLQKKKKYINAANIYLSSILLDPGVSNIESSFRIAECLIVADKSLDQAEQYLEHVIKSCSGMDDLKNFKSVAEAKLDLLRRNRSSKEKSGGQEEKNKES